MLSLGQSEPEPSPCAEFALGAPKVSHFLACVSSSQWIFEGIAGIHQTHKNRGMGSLQNAQSLKEKKSKGFLSEETLDGALVGHFVG
jgi:hypothetical protein